MTGANRTVFRSLVGKWELRSNRTSVLGRFDGMKLEAISVDRSGGAAPGEKTRLLLASDDEGLGCLVGAAVVGAAVGVSISSRACTVGSAVGGARSADVTAWAFKKQPGSHKCSLFSAIPVMWAVCCSHKPLVASSIAVQPGLSEHSRKHWSSEVVKVLM